MATEAISFAALPNDVLASVLAVLPPQSLAVAQCVCKVWRDIIDARAFLRPHLLPRSVRGVFINYIDHPRPFLFAGPSSSSTFPRIDGLPSFLSKVWAVLDHCNGLVLCSLERKSQLLVCNPATKRWTPLPSTGTADRSDCPYVAFDPTQRWTPLPSTSTADRSYCAYLTFDPIVSPHYEVFLIPDIPEKPRPPARAGRRKVDHSYRLMDWPPSLWSLKVFSSRTGLWEDRLFVREGQPAGTVEEMLLDPLRRLLREGTGQHYAVYQNGELYVHCRGSFVARFSLSTDKYQVIKMPAMDTNYVDPCLGGCKNDVYFGVVTDQGRELRVWMLSESCGRLEWLLKYEAHIGFYADYLHSLPYTEGRQPDGSWMVEEAGDDYVSDIFTFEAGDDYPPSLDFTRTRKLCFWLDHLV